MKEGDSFVHHFEITEEMIDRFAQFSGDHNPLHMDKRFAASRGFRNRVAHGAINFSMLSRILGTDFPGPGALWVAQSVEWLSPAYPGDKITANVEIAAVSDGAGVLALKAEFRNQNNEVVMRGDGKFMKTEPLSRDLNTKSSEAPLALVTDASRGIGAAIAKELAAKGAKVILNYRQDQRGAEDIAAEIKSSGSDALTIQADATNAQEMVRLFERIQTEVGLPNILVNNASPVFPKARLIDLTWDSIREYSDAILRSAVESSRLFIQPLLEKQLPGAIIHVGTTAITGVPPENWAAYVMAKSALFGLTKCLAVEYGKHGIRTNMVSPFLVEDAGLSSDIVPRLKKVAVAQNPMRRLCSAEEVAKAVVFLALEGAYVNGENLILSGGAVIP